MGVVSFYSHLEQHLILSHSQLPLASPHIPHSAAALHFNTHLTPRKVKELYFLQIKTIDFIYF